MGRKHKLVLKYYRACEWEKLREKLRGDFVIKLRGTEMISSHVELESVDKGEQIMVTVHLKSGETY